MKDILSNMYSTLREKLKDWTDIDITMHYLAIVLGIDKPPEETDDKWEYKWVYWTNNSISKLLDNMIQDLVKNGILEYDEEEMMFRWNPNWSLESVNNK